MNSAVLIFIEMKTICLLEVIRSLLVRRIYEKLVKETLSISAHRYAHPQTNEY